MSVRKGRSLTKSRIRSFVSYNYNTLPPTGRRDADAQKEDQARGKGRARGTRRTERNGAFVGEEKEKEEEVNQPG